MQSVLLCIGTVLLLQPILSMAFADSDDADDSGFARTRRGWSMMRLGRGLQMLRLGKRAPSSSPLDPSAQASPEQMRALLSSMVDEARNDFRRQPPLPRYGRDLEVAQDTADDLYSLLGDGYVSGVLPLHYSRFMHQGRFKRSVAGARFQAQLSDYDQSLDDSRIRAVALPRIGRYLGRLYKFRPGKAVPAPRIGRQDFAQDKPSSSGSSGQKVKRQDQFSDQQASSDSASQASQMSL